MSQSPLSSSPDTPRQPSLWPRILLWLFFVYLYTQIIQFRHGQDANLFIAALYFVEFGVHEVSHIIVMFLPPILIALAGSAGEIGFTALIAYAGFRTKSYFAGIFGLLWMALAMNSVGRYIADARAQAIPLIGPGDTVQHDWHFILSQLNLLESDVLLGTIIRVSGDIVGAVALIVGLIVLIKLYINR